MGYLERLRPVPQELTMPTYEYRCPELHEFELFQRMSDEPVARCPVCGKQAERLLSGGGGLLFKGEGFYITDYRSSEYKKKAREEGSGRPGAEGGGNAGSGSGSAGAPSDTTSTSTGGGSTGSGSSTSSD